MQFTDQNFKQEVKENEKLVLVDFFAPWCAPCKLMAPVIEELIKDYEGKNVKIGSLDIEENRQIAEQYNIMSIPTTILFKHGKIIEQVVGYQNKESLQQIINRNS
ncbi:MAG: thioredoxin [Patescibacteria group bacterium]|nr:thioredoxin [Patescibacteria group bacterium]